MTSTLPELYKASQEFNAKSWAFQIYMGDYNYRNIPLTGINASGHTLPMLTSHFQRCLLYFAVKSHFKPINQPSMGKCILMTARMVTSQLQFKVEWSRHFCRGYIN